MRKMSALEETQYIQTIVKNIYDISGDIRILSSLAWPDSVKEQFFKTGAKELPHVEYPSVEIDSKLERLEACRSQLEGTEFDGWLNENIDCIEDTLRLLHHRGSAEFTTYSKRLYGSPEDTLPDEVNTSLGLAKQLLETISPLKDADLGEPPAACILASTVAESMQGVMDYFGEDAPEIIIEPTLSANALASSERIRIRDKACFTENDIQQLIEHEIFIHAGTMLNGKQSGNVALLGTPLARTTKTQEGLAVFSEFITGNMDLDRLSRLAHRVIAIQMALEGANFIEIFEYFLELGISRDQSFENARRVFRGGVVEGGSPFTKDIVYLDGLLRVHNFMRAAVRQQKSEFIRLLFVGRLDIEDLPMIRKFMELGLCCPPKYLPGWVRDMRFLLSYLSYSSFLNHVDMHKVSEHYTSLLSSE